LNLIRNLWVVMRKFGKIRANGGVVGFGPEFISLIRHFGLFWSGMRFNLVRNFVGIKKIELAIFLN
jgi:hypothetical protein